MKCLLVDDEPLAIAIIENYLSQLEDFETIGNCRNAVEAYNFMRKQPVDLIFLDIEMPKITGLEFLKNLHKPPYVIITTAHREFALEGFDLNVLDYLLKPIRLERFLQAIHKIPVENSSNASPCNDFIYLKSEGKNIKIKLNQIRYIEGLSNYVKVVLEDKKPIITYLKMQDLENILPQESFMRIHRSYIVSKDKITAYSKNEIELGSTTLSIGGQYIRLVRRYFGGFDVK